MKVAVVCDVLGRENNGTTIAAMNLIRSLKAKGHEVRVVCPDEERRGEEGFFVVPTIDFGVLNDYVEKNGVRLAKRDERVLREALAGVDVMHTITPFFLTMKAISIAKETNIPITSGFHCQAENFTNHIFMMNSTRINRRMYEIFYKHVYRYSDCIHFPTQFICDVFLGVIGKNLNHRVISNGVNKAFQKREVERPRELRDRFVILFTGRYSKEKSHTVLIDAVKRSKYASDIQLIFAGSGPQKEHLEQYARERLKNQPIFNFFSREEMIDVINYSDLYVHPAEIEIEAISCLEAISCGLVPVISNSKRSATRFFALDSRNHFKCNDSRNLAAKIDYWISHPEEKAKCSESYLGYAKRFDFDLCMDRMERMLLDAIDEKR
ncbi:MAG: glycosyltransferase [Clostridia bacterium]|nr:glycosyltransferase [Clostridia bacterium]